MNAVTKAAPIAQHTPGPWYAGVIPSEQTTVSSHGFKVKAMPISGSGRAIGCVYAGDARPERRIFEDPTPEANACLIAAAPDLLAALRQLERAVSAKCAHQLHAPLGIAPEFHDLYAQVVQARAVIAKAEGR